MSKISETKNKLSDPTKIQRFRYRQYSCLLAEIKGLFFCYVFLGKSYLAINKMHKLYELIPDDFISDIMMILFKLNL